VPAERDQDDVTGADLGENVDLAFRGAVDPQVCERVGALRSVGGGLDLVVVDLLELRLDALAASVVLVRWVGAPVAGRGDDLTGDERLGVEDAGHSEVADLTGGLAGAAQLDRHLVGRQMPEGRDGSQRLRGHDRDGEGDATGLVRLEDEI
jgi:hypothetical protein